MLKHLVPLIGLMSVLSGCASPGNDLTQSGEGSINPLAGVAGSELAPVKDLTFGLNECYLTSSSFDWFGDFGPGAYPDGWEPRIEDGVIGSSDFIEIISCARLAWGTFERPAILLAESHDKFTPPERCERAGSDWFLHKIWTNDAEVANFMTSQFRIPTKVAAFEARFENSTESVRLTWSWISPDSGPSELSTLVLLPEPQDLRLTIDRRYILDRGDGISTIDLNYSALVPTSDEQFASGSFDSSTLHASTGISTYVGTADYWTDVSASGSISEFGDYLCEQPFS